MKLFSTKNLSTRAACILVILNCSLHSNESNAQDSSRVRTSILYGRSVLPAKTFAPGPTSGKLIQVNATTNIQEPVPFADKQPVQGFSAIHKVNDTTFMVMSDNGYGSIENSADFNLRVHVINPHLKTKQGGSGQVEYKSFIELSDPDKKIPFTITNHFSATRVLTGADFDIESMQVAADGSIWFGDEFGPFLIHTDQSGKVLEAPYSLPDFANAGKNIMSPQNPYYEEANAIRIMNAMKNHAAANGNTKTPVFSPNYQLIDDTNRIKVPNRDVPPAGVDKASSDIFNVSSIKTAGYPVVVWTVNDSSHIVQMMRQGVSGIISDNPDLLRRIAFAFDGTDADALPDFVDANGLLDITKFDAQGHRGGRNLRPENTLPAMEASLDNLMTTLEMDCGVTKDSVAVLSHDSYLEDTKIRRKDGQPYTSANKQLIKNLTLAQVQSEYVADKLLADRLLQKNDPSLSPAAVAFTAGKNIDSPYIIPSLQQVFDFVAFYAAYYKTGAGAAHPDAAKRAMNAERIRFNIETKMNPRTDTDPWNNVYIERTLAPEGFTKAVAATIISNQLSMRADIQSFDFRSLKIVHETYPAIKTVFLFTDGPKLPVNTEEGTNLQPQGGVMSPWLIGMYWPYRSTFVSTPTRAKRSGGFEGMALDSSKTHLRPLIELPLTNGNVNKLPIFEFDLATKAYTANRWEYALHPRGTNIGDFVMYTKTRGLIIERDGSEGKMDAFKAIYEVQFNDESSVLSKRLAVDLLNIRDTNNLTASTALEGDIGLGSTFGFPFQTIEDVVILGPNRIAVLNDNNYPFSIGRHVGLKNPDDNEFIVVDLDRTLGAVSMSGLDTLGYYPSAVTGFWNSNTGEDSKLMIQASPNPFTGATRISITLPGSSAYSVAVVNSTGQLVRTLIENGVSEGKLDLEWNGSDAGGNKLPAGMYVVRVWVNDQIFQQKVMLKN